MSDFGLFTKNLVEEYANLKINEEYEEGETEKDKKIRVAMKEKTAKEIYEQLCEDIYNLKKEKIINDGKKKLKEIERKKQRSQLKFILIEGIILGGITGIAVNQITDVITYAKGGSNNYQATLWIIVILLLLAVIFAFVVYLNKIEEYFTRDKEEEE